MGLHLRLFLSNLRADFSPSKHKSLSGDIWLKIKPNWGVKKATKKLNLSPGEMKALKSLQSVSSIVLMYAGGVIVITDTVKYECKRQLLGGGLYTHLPSDPTDIFNRQIKEVLEDAVSNKLHC